MFNKKLTIRKTWNLRFTLVPLVFFALGYIGVVLLEGARWMAFICLLWPCCAAYVMFRKCRCPKCKHPFKCYEHEELSMFTGYYWPSGLKLKCKKCGELLE